ncbi:MAG: hypothetical protein JW866_08570 [Ignavibacteriales bacterium]|nr:hypothetical protein [Ignavibacteriales bacterium]
MIEIRKIFFVILNFYLSFSLYELKCQSFLNEQKSYSKVNQAFDEKEKALLLEISQVGVDNTSFEIFLRAFKKERILEVWIKNKSDKSYTFFKDYDFCAFSGILGPKRKEGDLQIPEGIYHIIHFNPLSDFFLSLGLNYPNESDKILSDKKKPGSDIYIHGGCATIGCIPITDDKIKELYVLAVLAKSYGQIKIYAHIFPTKLEGNNFLILKIQYMFNKELREFWENLQPIYFYFEENKFLPKFKVQADGKYAIY